MEVELASGAKGVWEAGLRPPKDFHVQFVVWSRDLIYIWHMFLHLVSAGGNTSDYTLQNADPDSDAVAHGRLLMSGRMAPVAKEEVDCDYSSSSSFAIGAILSGNLVQLKDGTCEGKKLTGVRQRQSFTGWFLSGCYLVDATSLN